MTTATRLFAGFGVIAALAACGERKNEAGIAQSATGGATVRLAGSRVVSSPGAAYVTHSMAISGAGVHAYVWVEGTDQGTLFVETDSAKAAPLPDHDGYAGLDPETPPKIAFGPRGELYVAYQVMKKLDPEKDPSAAVRVIRSDDNGRTWSSPSNVSDNGPWGRYRNDHVFHVARDGTLYTAWIDLRDTTKTQIYTAASTDRGATWSRNSPIDLDEACACCRMALASAADGRVFIAWRKVLPGGLRDIVVASSKDRGATWGKPVLAFADNWKIDGCPDAGPSMLADGDGRLHLAWWTGKEGAAGVKYVSSPDGGATWGAPVPLRVAQFSQPSHVQLARGDNGSLYAAWEDGTVKEARVVLAVSPDNGRHFEPAVEVSAPGTAGSHPVVATAGKELVVAWHQADPATKGRRQVVARTASIP